MKFKLRDVVVTHEGARIRITDGTKHTLSGELLTSGGPFTHVGESVWVRISDVSRVEKRGLRP